MANSKYIEFIQYNIPGLQIGRYTLNVQQSITTPQQDNYSRVYTFDVPGDRFTLANKDVHGVYPPNGASGTFNKVLPHITLSRVRFPWRIEFDPTNEYCPWLALLVFDEEEQPKIVSGIVQDLVDSSKTVEGFDASGNPTPAVQGLLPANVLSHFTANAAVQVLLNVSESPSESCNYIDIPAAVFNKIAPSASDMAYLAHVRKVTTTNKSSQHQKDIYSTIVANRIPQLGKRSVVHLVSLDGIYTAMPKNSDYTPQLDPAFTSLRLVSLYSWMFDTVSDQQEFTQTLEQINLGTTVYNTGTLTYPLTTLPPTAAIFTAILNRLETNTLQAGDADLFTAYIVAMGYSAFPHQTRGGGQTVSWYRGPLVPYQINSLLTDLLPSQGADALNGYNTATGIFDVSYGSAWQLGQLVGLKNQSVAEALNNWKRKIREHELTKIEKENIDKNYAEGSRLEKAITWLQTFTGNH
jgi:hypothetical protein